MFEQTETKQQETLKFKMNKQMETFSYNPSMNLSKESKWLLTLTSFAATGSVFNINDENDSFLITIRGHWQTKSAEKFFQRTE